MQMVLAILAALGLLLGTANNTQVGLMALIMQTQMV
jgi:hypothetical protein